MYRPLHSRNVADAGGRGLVQSRSLTRVLRPVPRRAEPPAVHALPRRYPSLAAVTRHMLHPPHYCHGLRTAVALLAPAMEALGRLNS